MGYEDKKAVCPAHVDTPNVVNMFDEKGRLSKEFLLKQGKCCNKNCYNCPYKKNEKCQENKQIVKNHLNTEQNNSK